jgi:glucosamine--fructose-6-phosphate aminotransferase (isomerizing)
MLSEIQEQPAALRRLLAEGWAEVRPAAEAIRSRPVSFAQMAARGTSDNAARYGQYLFGAHNRLAVGLATPSLYTVYAAPPRLEGALVVGLSQSGQSPDVAEVVEAARAQGAITAGITNYPDSRLARAAAHAIWLRAGEERSIPATKTYTAQLLALGMLSTAMNPSELSVRSAELQAVPNAVARALELQAQVNRLAQGLASADRMVVIGRGFNFATAFEIALKLQEAAYVLAQPFSSADFKHGPLSIVEEGLPALVLAPAGPAQAELVALARDLHEWGARVILVSDAASPDWAPAGWALQTPAQPEWLSPFPIIAAGQLLAEALTRAKGLNPDQPRRLRKVTATR